MLVQLDKMVSEYRHMLGVLINLAPGLYNVNNNKLQRENWIMPMVQTVLQFDQLVIVLSRCPETQ